MSLWDTVRKWFTSEAESARDLAHDLETEWSADLDRKEAELAATPEERIEQLQDQIADNSSAFDDLKARIEPDGLDVDEPSDEQPS
jgi:hypothetical protein